MTKPGALDRLQASLADVATPVLSYALSLRDRSDLGAEDSLRDEISSYLDRMQRDGERVGFARDELNALRLPLVAFLDETLIHSHWERRHRWVEFSLGLKYFHEAGLGQLFFSDLQQLRKKAPADRGLLEVYFLCLLLGFEGMYRETDRDTLTAIISDVGRELGYSPELAAEIDLSPNGKRRDSPLLPPPTMGLTWRMIMAVGCVVLLLLAILQFWIADIAHRA